ncbi:MAG TPA: lipocalin family protein, partial [Dyadobacter sp.]|nr:lipocalin family protein [Dyadobacter sp.]
MGLKFIANLTSMKLTSALLLSVLLLAACQPKTDSTGTKEPSRLSGTWQLVSARIITEGDTAITFPVPNREMIKMFTDNEFAFFNHNIRQTSKDSAIFSAGSGTYTLKGEDYTERLT